MFSNTITFKARKVLLILSVLSIPVFFLSLLALTSAFEATLQITELKHPLAINAEKEQEITKK